MSQKPQATTPTMSVTPKKPEEHAETGLPVSPKVEEHAATAQQHAATAGGAAATAQQHAATAQQHAAATPQPVVAQHAATAQAAAGAAQQHAVTAQQHAIAARKPGMAPEVARQHAAKAEEHAERAGEHSEKAERHAGLAERAAIEHGREREGAEVREGREIRDREIREGRAREGREVREGRRERGARRGRWVFDRERFSRRRGLLQTLRERWMAKGADRELLFTEFTRGYRPEQIARFRMILERGEDPTILFTEFEGETAVDPPELEIEEEEIALPVVTDVVGSHLFYVDESGQRWGGEVMGGRFLSRTGSPWLRMPPTSAATVSGHAYRWRARNGDSVLEILEDLGPMGLHGEVKVGGMIDAREAQGVADALRTAGQEHLDDAGKRFLAQRVGMGWATSTSDEAHNIGRLADLSFGVGASNDRSIRQLRKKEQEARDRGDTKEAEEIYAKLEALEHGGGEPRREGGGEPRREVVREGDPHRDEAAREAEVVGREHGEREHLERERRAHGERERLERDRSGRERAERGRAVHQHIDQARHAYAERERAEHERGRGERVGWGGRPGGGVNRFASWKSRAQKAAMRRRQQRQGQGPQPGDDAPFFEQVEQFDDFAGIGGIGSVEFGFAAFPSLDVAAKTLVGVAFRAGPRDWSKVSDDEMGALSGAYPALETWPGDASVPLGWWPGFGPSPEAEAVFRSLCADWVAFERAGVGDKVCPACKPDATGWSSFHSRWLLGTLASKEIGSGLAAQVAAANRVRQALKTAGVKDPALDKDAVGIAPGQATRPEQALAAVEALEDRHPALQWLTKQRDTPLGTITRGVMTVGTAIAFVIATIWAGSAAGHAMGSRR